VGEDLEPDEAGEAAEQDARRDEDGAPPSRVRGFAGPRVRRFARLLVQGLAAVS
jgi:hypothetical protein